MAVKQREDAAAFMRNPSSGVAACLDRLDTEDNRRARNIRGELSGYRTDRREAQAGWGEKPKAKAATAPIVTSAKAVTAQPIHTTPAHTAPSHSSAPHQGGHTPGQSKSDGHGGDSK